MPHFEGLSIHRQIDHVSEDTAFSDEGVHRREEALTVSPLRKGIEDLLHIAASRRLRRHLSGLETGEGE